MLKQEYLAKTIEADVFAPCVARSSTAMHDDVIKWKHFPRHWPFVRGIHRSPVNSPHKGQWRGALVFSLICVWINDWVNNGEAGDLRRYRIHYDVTVMGIDYIGSTDLCLWQITISGTPTIPVSKNANIFYVSQQNSARWGLNIISL